MVEKFDALGRRIHPEPEIETTPRQWVVAVGRAAEEILTQRYGLKPSQESIVFYVDKIKGRPEEKMVLNKRANLILKREFETEVERFIRERMSVSAAQRLAKQLIRERYEEIEKDSQRNFAFLDPILFSREGGQVPI